MRIGVILLTGPYQTESADTAIHFVEAALKKGHTVKGVFLFMDGVYNSNRNVNPPGERNVVAILNAVGEKVPVTVCAACARFRGMKKDNLTENVRLGGLGELVNLVQSCDRIITFGG
ncbi:MAG: DsrE family protein [Theionarchaea archaeon]|nr:DsrE family protein [Theionarchaea archaeon]MBU6999266.1 DsrE family protein [Theionarchaea archaeon]MBU7019609.1 DsrE family protein [Theionarchaea archaeon]MBU7033788.1 DsrE family protein [Theionarchaea archaeon]MBU7040198.1 DsrE family protein [Theionarchaea archaeon]